MKRIKKFDKAKFNFTDEELVADILDMKLLDINYPDEEGEMRDDKFNPIQSEGSE